MAVDKNLFAHDLTVVAILKMPPRAENFSVEIDAEKVRRMTDALIKNLSAEEFSLETALTCRAASNLLGEKFLEEAALGAVLKSFDGMKLSDVRLLLSELPELLGLPYPAVNELRGSTLEIISQTMNFIARARVLERFFGLGALAAAVKKI